MRGFTLIELIFVIVIMGILTFTALSFIPNDRSLSDTQILKTLILEKKTNALGFRADMNNNEEKEKVCITFDKDELNNKEKSQRVKYKFESDISSDIKTICFDEFGRPFKDEVDEKLKNLLKQNLKIKLKYANKENNITLYKFSGDVE